MRQRRRKERVVLLTRDAAAVLQAWLNARPPSAQPQVFLNERGQPLTVNGLEWLLHQYATQAGVAVTPHRLRHTFARQLTEAGMPVTSLGKLLGHADISTTQLYTAGADPELSAAYQHAMHRLNTLPRVTPLPPAVSLPRGKTPTAREANPPPRALPTWDTWAPDLPEAIRQACLQFVQRRLPTWKPQRQRLNAQKALSEFQRFWRWQGTRRAVSQPGELSLADLRAYQTEQRQAGKAPTTINRSLDYLLTLLKDLADQGQPVNPSVFRLRPLPRPDSLPRHLSEAEAQTLETYVRTRLDSPDPRVQLVNACYFVLAHTGLRASECLDLQIQDVDSAGGRLVVRAGKGQRDRVVYLSPTAQSALRQSGAPATSAPTAFFFSQRAGQALSSSWLYKQMLALGKAAGVTGVTPHRLRHTLATRLLNAGLEITRIQKLLGHDHLNTTMIYARVLDQTLETDYQRAMRQIERQQMPLADTPEAVPGWPQKVERQVALDNSV